MRRLILLVLLTACAPVTPAPIQVEHKCDVVDLQGRVEWIARNYDWRMNTLSKRVGTFDERFYKLEQNPPQPKWLREELDGINRRIRKKKEDFPGVERRLSSLELDHGGSGWIRADLTGVHRRIKALEKEPRMPTHLKNKLFLIQNKIEIAIKAAERAVEANDRTMRALEAINKRLDKKK